MEKKEELSRVIRIKKVVYDGYSRQKFNHVRQPVVDEDFIGKRGQAHRDYGGGTRLTCNDSNVIQVPSTPYSPTPAKSETQPLLGVREDEGEASDNRWIKKVWKRIKRNVKKGYKKGIGLCKKVFKTC